MLEERKTKPKTNNKPRMNNQNPSAHPKMNKKYHCFLSFVLQPGMCQDQNILTDVTIFVQLFNYVFFPGRKGFWLFPKRLWPYNLSDICALYNVFSTMCTSSSCFFCKTRESTGWISKQPSYLEPDNNYLNLTVTLWQGYNFQIDNLPLNDRKNMI